MRAETPFDATLGYDHACDGEDFYLGLALNPAYVQGYVEGCLERIGEDQLENEELLRDLREEGDERRLVKEALEAGYEVKRGDLRGLDPLPLGPRDLRAADHAEAGDRHYSRVVS